MTWWLACGDSREVLPALQDASVDSVVCDPPYELGFMGRSWDSSGIAYDVSLWREVLRVLKPGGHLLAFGGTRTYHRMACAIEDAGFEVRDSLHWIYGSGFPKSLDVSKAVDKADGHWRGKAGAIASGNVSMGGPNYERTSKGDPITDAAPQWSGWGTALKPAHEPIVVARKPLDGTVAANVLAHGTGALNIDGTRVGYASAEDFAKLSAGVSAIKARGGSMEGSWANHSDLSGANDASTLGRWPPNILLSHAPDCGDECAEGCAVAEMNTQSEGASRFFPVFRYQAKASRADRDAGLNAFNAVRTGAMRATENGSMLTGSGNERTTVRANTHPTVKPIELMQWLVRLVTPPGGLVLDPFAGSGSTGIAAVREGFRFAGIELSDEYACIARARIARSVTP